MENQESYAIHLKGKNDLEYVKLQQLNVASDYVLIEVKAAGIGPYDLYFINGTRSLQSGMVHVPGCEGSGIVRKVGSNVDSSLVGKNVAFFLDYNDPNARGSFSEHAVVPKAMVMEISQDKPKFSEAAYCLANPVTALGMYHGLLKGRKVVLQDTASGALGTIVTKLCVKNGIEIINICRKEENLSNLAKAGSKHNFASDSKTFLTDLKQVILDLKPDLYLTYTGGNFPSKVFDLLPNDSQMCNLGNMSGQDLDGFSSTDFIFKGKYITGWSIFNFAVEYSGGMKKLLEELRDSFNRGENTYDTFIVKEFSLKDVKEAIKFYSENMSKGKIVLTP